MSESRSAVRGTESLICQEKHREKDTHSDRLLLIYIFYASVHHAQIPVSDFRAHLFRPRGIRSPNSIKKKHRSTPGNKEFMHDDQQAGEKQQMSGLIVKSTLRSRNEKNESAESL